MKKLIYLIATFLFLLSTKNTYSICDCTSNITIAIINGPPTIVNTCEDYTLTIRVNNNTTSTCQDAQLDIDFDVLTYQSIQTIPTGIVNNTHRTYDLPDINPSSYIDFQVTVHYDCSSIIEPQQPLQSLIEDEICLAFGGVTCATQCIFVNYNLTTPFFIYHEQNVTAYPSTPLEREFQVENTGQNYFDNYFSFVDNMDVNSYLHFLGCSLEIISGTSTTGVVINPTVNNFTLSFDVVFSATQILPGDIILITEIFDVYGCPDVAVPTHINYSAGCSAAELCSRLSNNFNDVDLDIGAGSATPNILMTRIMPADLTQIYWDNSCTNSFLQWQFIFENTGVVTLQNPTIVLNHPNPLEFPFYTYIIANDAAHPITITGAGWTPNYTLLNTQFGISHPKCLDLPGFFNNALLEAELEITGDFIPQQVCTLTFYTYRCCPNDEDDENTAASEFDIFNTGIYFNHWRVHMDGTTLCSPQQVNYSSDNGNSVYGDGYLSRNIVSNPDLILEQEYDSPVSFMLVPDPDASPCGPSQEFVIKNTRFDTYAVQGQADQQLFQQTSTSVPSGEIVVRIQFDPGLDFDQTFAPFMISNDGTITWNSAGNFTYVNPYWEGRFTINTQFANYTAFLNFMSFSEFHFKLFPCCSANNNPHFNVKFYLNPLPPQVGAPCGPCLIPQYRTDDDVQIVCPGCITPGIETDIMTLQRDPASFGLYDSDNDGLADNSLLNISGTDAATQQNMRLNGSISGDLLNARMVGTFHDGEQNGFHNLRYNVWPFAPFQNIYFEQQIPHANDFNLTIVPNSVQLLIFPDACAGCTLTYTLLPTEYAFQAAGDIFFFKTNITNIQNGSTTNGTCTSCVPYLFQIDDKFELNVKYLVCNNFLKPGTSFNNLTAEDNRFDADPFGVMYFSNSNFSLATPAPYMNHTIQTAEENYTDLCGGPTAVDNCNLDITNLDPSLLYFCGGFGSKHRFYSVRVFTTSYNKNADANENNTYGIMCDKSINLRTVMAIGGAGKNIFPFEFRAPLDPAQVPLPQFSANIPVGFQASGAHLSTLFHTFLPGCYNFNDQLVRKRIQYAVSLTAGVHQFSHPSFSFAREIAPFGNLVSDGCSHDWGVLADPDLFIGDEFFQEDFTIEIYPDCNIQDCEVVYTAAETQAMLYTFDPLTCGPIGPNWVNNQNTSAPGNFTMPYLDLLGNNNCPTTPYLIMTTGSSINVSSQTVDFEIDLINNSTPANCLASPNTWIHVPNNSFLSNLRIIVDPVQTGFGCPLTLGSTILPNANQMFELGAIGCGSFNAPRKCDLILRADYNNCEGPGEHDLGISYGWNCGPVPNVGTGAAYSSTHYPATPNGACYHAPEVLEVDEAAVSFDVYDDPQFAQPSEFGYCQSSEFEACAISYYGGVFDINAIIQLPPNMVLDLSHDVLFCDGNNNCSVITSLVTGAPPTYQIDLQSLNPNMDYVNVPSTELLAFNRHFCIKYWAQTECGYLPSDGMPVVSFGATKFCSDIITPANGPQITITPTWSYSQVLGNSCNPLCIATEIVSNTNATVVCSEDITLTANVFGGDGSETFLWSPNGEITQSITFTPIAGQTVYYFTVTVTSGTAIATDDITLTLSVINSSGAECCIPAGFIPQPIGNDYDFSNNTAGGVFGLYGLSSPITTGNIILINGIFTVDRDLTFQSCTDIKMGPNAQIIVLPGYTLEIIDGTIITACEDMWEAVKVGTGGTLHVFDSFINDGINSIDATGTPDVIIHGNHFNRNLKAIYLHDGDFVNTHIYSNGFDCTSLLNNPYSTLYTKEQILISDAVNVSIGDANFGPNEINNGTFGVRAFKSNVSIDNCNFDWDVNTGTRSAINANGAGVCIACHYTLNVGINAPCNIRTYRTGIDVRERYNCYISGNSFEDNRSAVSITTCHQRSISINQNTFDRFNHGISIVDVVWAGVTINDNIFNHAGMHYDPQTFGRKAIEVQNSILALVTLTIQNNEAWYVQTGIHLRNVNSGLVDASNKIHYQIAPTDIPAIGVLRGIWLENCHKVQVLNNEVDWNSIPTINERDFVQGIAITSSIKCTVKENKMTQGGSGINFLGDCSTTNLYCNTMESCYHGIYLQDLTTVLTDQGTSTESWNNQWVSNIGPTKVEGNGVFNQFRWYYFVPDGPFFDPQPCNTNFVLATQASGHNLCTAPNSPMDDERRESAFGEIVGDSTVNDPDSLNFKYAGNETFYKTAKDDETLLDLNVPTDPIYQEKFEELQLSNIGKFEEAKDSLLNGNSTAAIMKLATIIDENLMEENKKYVASVIASEYNVELDADSDTVNVLNSIAFMHPFYGGEAVFWARAILHIDVDDIMPALRRGQFEPYDNITEVNELKGTLHPNPASNEVTFTHGYSDNAEVKIKIYDVYGKQIALYKLESKNITFNITGYHQAIYYIHVYINDLEKETHKLTIIK